MVANESKTISNTFSSPTCFGELLMTLHFDTIVSIREEADLSGNEITGPGLSLLFY